MNGYDPAPLQPSIHADGFARAALPPPDQWPRLLFDLPALHYPARFNCVGTLLGRRAGQWLGRAHRAGGDPDAMDLP